jgi:hypothetical protein
MYVKGLLGRCSPPQQPRLLPFPDHEKILNHEKKKKLSRSLFLSLEVAQANTPVSQNSYEDYLPFLFVSIFFFLCGLL